MLPLSRTKMGRGSTRTTSRRLRPGRDDLEDRRLLSGGLDLFPIVSPGYDVNPKAAIVSADGDLWFTQGFPDIDRVAPDGTMTQFPLPGGSNAPSASGLTVAPDGTIWFTQGTNLGTITLDGTIHEIPIPGGPSAGELTSDPSGNLWFIEDTGYVGEYQTDGTFSTVALPPAGGSSAQDMQILATSDGSIWVSSGSQAVIDRIAPDGSTAQFTIPGSQPYDWEIGLAQGLDGNVWFTEAWSNRVGSITPSGTITTYALPPGNREPWGITAGPDGNLWFTTMDSIGRISTDGTISIYAPPAGTTQINQGAGITTGPDGNLWFIENWGGDYGRLNPNMATPEVTITSHSPNDNGFTLTPIPGAGGGEKTAMVTAPDGSIWFADDTGRIGREAPDGTLTMFTIPTTNSDPVYGLAVGPDGKVWFSQGTEIGSIAPDGTVSLIPYHDPSVVYAMTFDSAGNLWYVESYGIVGEYHTDGTFSTLNVGPTGPASQPIVADASGNVWTTSAYQGIIRINPDGTLTGFSVANNNGAPLSLVVAPGGDIWFTTGYFGQASGTLGKLDPSGTVTEYSYWGVNPDLLTVGTDGNIWFTTSNSIGLINPGSGVVTLYSPYGGDPQLNGAEAITAGPGGEFGFTETAGASLGLFNQSQSSPVAVLSPPPFWFPAPPQTITPAPVPPATPPTPVGPTTPVTLPIEVVGGPGFVPIDYTAVPPTVIVSTSRPATGSPSSTHTPAKTPTVTTAPAKATSKPASRPSMLNWLTLDIRPYSTKPVVAQGLVPTHLNTAKTPAKKPAIVPQTKAEHVKPRPIKVVKAALRRI